MDADFLISAGQELNQRRPEPSQAGEVTGGPAPVYQATESPLQLLKKARDLGARADVLAEKIQGSL